MIASGFKIGSLINGGIQLHGVYQMTAEMRAVDLVAHHDCQLWLFIKFYSKHFPAILIHQTKGIKIYVYEMARYAVTPNPKLYYI